MARKVVTFTGSDAVGAVSVSGAKAGDVVLFMTHSNGAGVSSGTFADCVVVDGQIYQKTGDDLSGSSFTAILDRELVV